MYLPAVSSLPSMESVILTPSLLALVPRLHFPVTTRYNWMPSDDTRLTILPVPAYSGNGNHRPRQGEASWTIRAYSVSGTPRRSSPSASPRCGASGRGGSCRRGCGCGPRRGGWRTACRCSGGGCNWGVRPPGPPVSTRRRDDGAGTNVSSKLPENLLKTGVWPGVVLLLESVPYRLLPVGRSVEYPGTGFPFLHHGRQQVTVSTTGDRPVTGAGTQGPAFLDGRHQTGRVVKERWSLGTC